MDCPVAQNAGKDFVVAIHNTQIRKHNQLIRLLLPSQGYKAQEWNKAKNQWIDVPFDIIEQKHWDKHNNPTTDY